MANISSKTAVPRAGQRALDRGTRTVIDLSRDIHEGMPLWPGHQLPFKMVNQTHDGFKNRWGTDFGFRAHNWLMSEHTGTHTDAIFEYDPGGATLDDMPLEYYYGPAICLDVSHVRHPDYMTAEILEAALEASGQEIRIGDTVLLYSGHGDRTFGTKEFINVYSGLDRSGAVWLAEKGVVNIGIDSLAIDHSDDMTFTGHAVCAEYQIVNTENLTNLDKLVGRRFEYFGLPIHFREGTGSPIRAIAILN
ncbi:cyclase family protein [Paracoccus sp. SCSIO 75233]|uniref:cyclase family protein n=1 Tax=Paracoccus sp. SCSIO 75233 TaxID=3017782 RepID=UPI0022F0E1BA|nr:cyclase family protein [Paracoccus sp. SCSIO 75233]WBU55317.1 cyclase family protein [Paracoccus sp. SCSIO 75233]